MMGFCDTMTVDGVVSAVDAGGPASGVLSRDTVLEVVCVCERVRIPLGNDMEVVREEGLRVGRSISWGGIGGDGTCLSSA
jgi:hypothetical protein